MRRLGAIVAVLAALAGAACSKSGLSGGAPAIDDPASRVCTAVRQLVQARASGTLSAPELKTKAGAINNDAQASDNPLIRARAVALHAAATVAITGGETYSLDTELAAMNNLCMGGGVEPA